MGPDSGSLMTMQLDPAGLNEIRERFLTVEHDFGEFGDPDGAYHRNERLYKDELRRLVGELLPRSLFAGDPAERADEIAERVKSLLTRPVGLDGKPQNLMTWRYWTFLREMRETERASFARAMADLLFGTGSSGARIERFNRSMWPAWKRLAGSGNPYAVTRSFPTFFLMLQNPEHDIYVRTDTFDRASRKLLGRSVVEYAIFDAAGYEVILDFAGAVRRHLVRWGWSPRDLIDVQSFLYVGTIPDEALAAAIADQAP